MQWNLIILAYMSVFCFGIFDNSRAPCYPAILESFHLTTARGSMIFSLTTLASTIVNLFSRLWLPRLGALSANRVGLFFIGIGSLLVGFAGGYLHSFYALLGGCVLAGIGMGFSGICVNILVINGASQERKRNILSALHAVYGAAAFSAPFLAQLIFKIDLSWAALFIAIGILPLISLIYSWRIPSSTSREEARQEKRKITLKEHLYEGVMFASYVGAEVLVGSRLVLYLEKTEGFNEAKAALYMSIFFGLLLSGRTLLIFVKLNIKSNQLLLMSLLTTLLLFAAGFLIDPIFLACCGLTMSIFFPTAMGFLSEGFSDCVGKMTASVMTTTSIFLIIAHFLFGQFAETFGIRQAFYMAPAFIALSLVLVLSQFLKKATS